MNETDQLTVPTLPYLMWIKTSTLDNVLRKARAELFRKRFEVDKRVQTLFMYNNFAIWPPRLLRLQDAVILVEQAR